MFPRAGGVCLGEMSGLVCKVGRMRYGVFARGGFFQLFCISFLIIFVKDGKFFARRNKSVT